MAYSVLSPVLTGMVLLCRSASLATSGTPVPAMTVHRAVWQKMYSRTESDAIKPCDGNAAGTKLTGLFRRPSRSPLQLSMVFSLIGKYFCWQNPMAYHTIGICLAVIALSMVCFPVTAHSAAEMGISSDQYDQGIPVYWPYHAFLMSAGFILLLSGFVVMRYHRTSDWYKFHRILESAGGILAIAGLFTSVFMVSLSGAPHLRYVHDILGIVTIILILSTLLAGYHISGMSRAGTGIRTAHRWMGRISIALVGVNIVLGLSMMATVLAQ
jgi:hypothetical protein